MDANDEGTVTKTKIEDCFIFLLSILFTGVSNFMRDPGELFNRSYPKVSYEDFNRILQCNSVEMDLDWKRGSLKLAQLVPVTRGTLQVIMRIVLFLSSLPPFCTLAVYLGRPENNWEFI